MFEFEEFRLDPKHLLLFKGDLQMDLSPKVVETLLALVRNNGSVINKDDLMLQVWPDTTVDESNLFQNLYLLRKVLGNKSDGTPFIETLRRRGYRFSANVANVPQKAERLPVINEPTFSMDHSFSNGSLVVSAVVLVFLLITLFASVFYQPWRTSSDETVKKRFPTSIAVLPFRTNSNGASYEPLGLDICDALITRLGNRHQVSVRPTSAVRKYTNPEQNPVEIGQIQGVDAVLDGSLQRDGGRIRLTIQLIDTLSGATIWSSQIDTTDTNTLELQDQISTAVLGEMDRSLLPAT